MWRSCTNIHPPGIPWLSQGHHHISGGLFPYLMRPTLEASSVSAPEDSYRLPLHSCQDLSHSFCGARRYLVRGELVPKRRNKSHCLNLFPVKACQGQGTRANPRAPSEPQGSLWARMPRNSEHKTLFPPTPHPRDVTVDSLRDCVWSKIFQWGKQWSGVFSPFPTPFLLCRHMHCQCRQWEG